MRVIDVFLSHYPIEINDNLYVYNIKRLLKKPIHHSAVLLDIENRQILDNKSLITKHFSLSRQ